MWKVTLWLVFAWNPLAERFEPMLQWQFKCPTPNTGEYLMMAKSGCYAEKVDEHFMRHLVCNPSETDVEPLSYDPEAEKRCTKWSAQYIEP